MQTPARSCFAIPRSMEFMGPTLLCLDIIDPGALGRLLAEPIKQQLPVGLGD